MIGWVLSRNSTELKGELHTFTACSADLRAWSTCSTLLISLYSFKGKVATSPTAYTSGTLVLKNASVCNQLAHVKMNSKHQNEYLNICEGEKESRDFRSRLTLMPPFSSSTCPLNNVVRGLPPTPTTTMSASSTVPSFKCTSLTCIMGKCHHPESQFHQSISTKMAGDLCIYLSI